MKHILFLFSIITLINISYSQSDRWVLISDTSDVIINYDKDTFFESFDRGNHKVGVWVKFEPKIQDPEIKKILIRYVIHCKNLEIIESMREEYYIDGSSKTFTSGEKHYIIPETIYEYLFNYFCK